MDSLNHPTLKSTVLAPARLLLTDLSLSTAGPNHRIKRALLTLTSNSIMMTMMTMTTMMTIIINIQATLGAVLRLLGTITSQLLNITPHLLTVLTHGPARLLRIALHRLLKTPLLSMDLIRLCKTVLALDTVMVILPHHLTLGLLLTPSLAIAATVTLAILLALVTLGLLNLPIASQHTQHRPAAMAITRLITILPLAPSMDTMMSSLTTTLTTKLISWLRM